jgi:hypothetical protein
MTPLCNFITVSQLSTLTLKWQVTRLHDGTIFGMLLSDDILHFLQYLAVV